MIRLEFIVLVSLGLATGVGISWWASQHEETVHAAGDCVAKLWLEHEDRTGEMPSVSLEKEWWKQCAESSNG